MTYFERDYILSKPNKIAIAYSSQKNKDTDLTEALERSRRDIAMQAQYRELDRLSMELEREIQACKALRMEMERYKVDFNFSIQDEATKKIQDVIEGIDRLLK